MAKRGRGNGKIEQDGVVRKVGVEHGQPIIRLPKSLLELGMYMSQEVIIVRREGENTMAWELVIKPKQADDNEPQ